MDGNPTIAELCGNVHRVIKKIHRELEPGNDRDSNLINLVNHLETLMQEIESANK
jgi:hypothetical protein